MMIPPTLRRNTYGYYEVIDKPSPAELKEYYAKQYYQQSKATYQSEYSAEEREHLVNKLKLRHFVVEDLRQAAPDIPGQPSSSLDVGCGEGWALAYFREQNWQVLGLDYGHYGLERFHPELRENLRTGDLYEQLRVLWTEGHRFDLLWMDNVLEHVTDPKELLRLCRALVAPHGVLMVEVPNDFSVLQEYLFSSGHINQPFWVALPDHLSYFNRAGLTRLGDATGWHTARILADHPIDLDLLNPATNYVRNRAVGPASHQTRIALDNLLMRTSTPAAVASYYHGLAEVGLGRNLVAFLQPV
jgi:2-polyprenyl-3-methyl-5-hydroxy-6-metoxy-1,4-benzoquinol methylase